MIPAVGQRWLWVIKCAENTSEIIIEILEIDKRYTKCICIQVISKGYETDYIGYIQHLPVGYFKTISSISVFTYLEGQDKP